MYMDMDSILYQDSCKSQEMTATRWFSRVEERELDREDLCVLYGCWADDAAHSEFLAPVHGADRKSWAYAV